ncbi:hypothetical protein ACFW04_000851 [Cataglyphis niger]
MSKHLFVYCILMGFVAVSNSLSILLIEALPSPSHHLWTTNLAKGLLRKGHHVHVVSIQETKIKGKLGQNLTYAVFDNIMKDMHEDEENYNPAEWEKYSVFYMTQFIYEWSTFVSEKIIETKGAKELLEMIKKVEFDVIVQDITIPECLYGLWEVNIKNLLMYKYLLFLQLLK